MFDRDLLARMLSGRVVVACIGNQWRGDDGAGPFIAGLIEVSERVAVVDCGDTPENFLGVISRLKPERIVVIDAADFGGSAGEIRAVARSEIAWGSLSTHAPRLTLFTDFIEAQTGAETFFLAIQPENLAFGRPLGAQVEAACRGLADQINREIAAAGL
jgi:hydrogenase 3 maturation protease